MRKRTFEEIMKSKALYRKHATRYKANGYPEHRAKRMLAYTAKLTKAIAVSSQEARTASSTALHEELEAEQKQTSTDEPQPPKFIRENCGTCDNSLYAREVMEYTGKFREVPFIQDDGTKLMEYEYLYKCCKCGSKLWVPEQMAKESAIDELQEAESKTIQQRNEYIHNKLKQLDQVKDARKHTRRLARIMTYHRLLTDVEVSTMRQRLQKAFNGVSLKGSDDNERNS